MCTTNPKKTKKTISNVSYRNNSTFNMLNIKKPPASQNRQTTILDDKRAGIYSNGVNSWTECHFWIT